MRTYESIGRPLPGRTTIVVTRQEDWQPEGGLPDGLLVAGSVEAALAWAAGIDDEVFVAGGAQVYAAALPVTDALVMTWVDAEPEGDTYFPEVDWDDVARGVARGQRGLDPGGVRAGREKKFRKSVTPGRRATIDPSDAPLLPGPPSGQ